MKNQRLESLFRSQKEVCRQGDNRMRHGIVQYHQLPRKKTYWEDLKFRLGDKFVCVFLQHPRYVYWDEIMWMKHYVEKPVALPSFVDELLTGNSTVTPSWEIIIHKYARHMNIIAPIEILNREDLYRLKHLAIKLINGETTLEKEFPNYSYNKDSFVEEIDEEEKIGLELYGFPKNTSVADYIKSISAG